MKLGKVYFTKHIENKIYEYNNSTNPVHAEKIYEEYIHPVLNKLVENVIHKYKFYYYESTYKDLKHETVVYLHDRLCKITPEKGKAYSYLTVVARNYLIVRTNDMYNSIRNRDELCVVDEERNLVNEVYEQDAKDILHAFIKEWSHWGIENVETLFSNDRDRKIAEAVFVLFRNCDDIDTYNKKALYILIREHARVRTQYITKVVKILKNMFNIMYNEYYKSGKINYNVYLLKNEDSS